MEDDRERPYSVLTKDEVKEKMKKQIDEISEIFLVSKSDSTILLMYLRWDSLRVSERLSENKEKLLRESGLKSVVIDSNRDLSGSDDDDDHVFDVVDDVVEVYDNAIGSNRAISDSSCGICFKTCDEIVDGDDLISTPICSHKFCTTCWRDYLDKNFYSLEKNQTVISCPDKACRAAVGPDTIEKLTVEDKEMYERFILRSYIEENRVLVIKLCPAPDCNYAIEFHEDENDEEYSLNVVCLCGHTFCWRCMLESHRPVTCNNASDWLSTDLKVDSDESLSLSWIQTNKKLCPHCHRPVEMDGARFRRFLTCPCRFRFCWKCMKSEESHKNEAGYCRACVVTAKPMRPEVRTSCADRWEAGRISMEEAKSDLRYFEKNIFEKPSILKEQDIMIVRQGLMLIVQCRQVLKWSCVYDYFHTEYEISKKEYLRFLQDNATTALQSYLQTLLDETEGALSAGANEELGDFRHKLSTATSNIGNYFYHFIKTLQDGLVEVKVKSYGLAGPYWFCDRCTYGNTWLDKECKMCCDPTASSVEELSGLSLN